MNEVYHLFKHIKSAKNHFQKHGKKYLFGTLWTFAIVKMVLLFMWFFSTLDLGKSFAQTPVVLSKDNIVSMGCATDNISCNLSNKWITNIENDAFVNHIQLQTLDLSFNKLNSLPENIVQLINLQDNWWLNINFNHIYYEWLSSGLLSFIDQKSSAGWRSTQTIVRWCTDPTAYNYDPDATNNDWTCKYPPTIIAVEIEWSNVLGNLLTWKYIYSWDVAEWESLYQWYREETPILWATGITYMTVGDDLWKILALKITPVNQEGIHWEPAMSDWLYILDPSTNLNNIILRVTVWTANQTLTLNKYFDVSNYTVDRWDGTTGTISTHLTKTYNNIGTYYVELQNPWDRWKFSLTSYSLVPQSWTTVDNVKIVYMPSLADWFGESASNPGDNFFRSFNSQWALSFDNLTSLKFWYKQYYGCRELFLF